VDTVQEALKLLSRRAALETALKSAGGIRIAEERELFAILRQLRHYPAAIEAALQTAHSLNRPISELTVADVERWAPTSEA
jgi:hypothetical protein